MKVSDLLKKIGSIGGAEIHIEFKADKKDPDPDVVMLDEYTSEETANQIIERAAGYTLQEVNFENNVVTVTAIRAVRRQQKQKENKAQDVRREKQKQEIREELDELKRAVAELFAAIAEPFRQIMRQKPGRRNGIMFRATAAIRRILTRIFGKGADEWI
mgnify:FL=1